MESFSFLIGSLLIAAIYCSAKAHQDTPHAKQQAVDDQAQQDNRGKTMSWLNSGLPSGYLWGGFCSSLMGEGRWL